MSVWLWGGAQKLDKELEQALAALGKERDSAVTNLDQQVNHPPTPVFAPEHNEILHMFYRMHMCDTLLHCRTALQIGCSYMYRMHVLDITHFLGGNGRPCSTYSHLISS